VDRQDVESFLKLGWPYKRDDKLKNSELYSYRVDETSEAVLTDIQDDIVGTIHLRDNDAVMFLVGLNIIKKKTNKATTPTYPDDFQQILSVLEVYHDMKLLRDSLPIHKDTSLLGNSLLCAWCIAPDCRLDLVLGGWIAYRPLSCSTPARDWDFHFSFLGCDGWNIRA
jgi:hypothetical protein